MASRLVRQIGWLVAADIALILLLFAFGLALSAMKIPMEGHPFLTNMLAAHGVIFGVVLPLAMSEESRLIRRLPRATRWPCSSYTPSESVLRTRPHRRRARRLRAPQASHQRLRLAHDGT